MDVIDNVSHDAMAASTGSMRSDKDVVAVAGSESAKVRT